MPAPAEFRKARGKGWRFFEWFSQKILPGPCLEKSLFWLKKKALEKGAFFVGFKGF